jgi:flagellar biosynthetic protein FliP
MRGFWIVGFAVVMLLLGGHGAWAQAISIDFADEMQGEASGRIFQLGALITVLSLAPSILVMVTSFTRIIIVFSFLRTALGLQQTPPNVVLIGLALFMTLFIMTPTLEEAYTTAIEPMMAEKISEEEALKLVGKPFHAFMRKQVREKDVALFVNMVKKTEVTTPEALPFRILIPAFILSELRRAFEMGFLIFIPFLIIDMVVSSILMSMGMMMLPPISISLPFKLIFFVLVDGWYILAGSLVQSFG